MAPTVILADVLSRKGISKRRFARMIGQGYSNTFRYYRPEYDPKLSTLAKWAAALGVRVRDLIREK